VAGLEWAGRALPECARVLVAPGSAAEYLPEYAQVRVLFPAFPAVYNLSYDSAVTALVAGQYNGSIRGDLLALSVDAVFVTGRTTVQFPPFEPSAFEGSSDFSPVFLSGDAEIYAFLPGVSATGCPIPSGVG
jgi:hypothetical protein